MKLKAAVPNRQGRTKHSLGTIIDGKPLEVDVLPKAKWLEIVEEESGVFLYHYNGSGECVSDTWHLSISEAQSQAEYEFQIKKSDWIEVD